MLDFLYQTVFTLGDFKVKYWMLILVGIAAYWYHTRPQKASTSMREKFAQMNEANASKRQDAPIPELIVCMAPWCGHTQRFMGMDGKNDGPKSYEISGKIYSNTCGGKTVSDWEILKGTFSGSSDVKIREINFDEPRDQPQTQQEIINLLGDISLEGFPTIYLKVGKAYFKFGLNRRADHIIKWMKEITGKDYMPLLEKYLSANNC